MAVRLRFSAGVLAFAFALAATSATVDQAAAWCPPSILAADTTWRGDVDLPCTVIVPQGVTLTIAPGTTLHITGFWDTRLLVAGRLEARGTPEHSIRFDVGGDKYYWGGIVFVGRDAGGAIEHCEFHNGRRFTVTCQGASPDIRDNRFRSTTYGGGAVVCSDGSTARVAGNLVEGSGEAAMLLIGASPSITDNTITGYRIAVVVSDSTAGIRRDPASLRSGESRCPREAVPPTVQPHLSNNHCDGALFVLDEREVRSDRWSLAFTSELLRMPLERRWESRARGRGEEVSLLALDGLNDSTRTMRATQVLHTERGYTIGTQWLKADMGTSEWWERWPYGAGTSLLLDGRRVWLGAVTTALGQLWFDGCMDTKPSHVLLLAEPDQPGQAATLLWAGPRMDRGLLLSKLADVNRDGLADVLVATMRQCEERGQIFVFEQRRNGDASKR